MNASPIAPQAQTIARHIDDAAGRYACYPGIAQFRSGFGDAGFVDALRVSNGDPIPAKLSIHIGAPDRFGLYPVGAARDESARIAPHPAAYLSRLVRQIAAVGALCDRDRDVVQLGLSPGATDFFDAEQIAEIVESLSRNFHFSNRPDRDFAATLSADALSRTDLRTLVDAGCNRAGFAIGHIDSQAAATAIANAPDAAVARCRAAGFRSVRIDVVFGAFVEDFDCFCGRLATVVRAAPDVVALRDVAHLPESFAPETGGVHAAVVRADMLCHAWCTLIEAGYAHVGMGVFAVPSDTLLRAKSERRLHRDALGFGVHGTTDLIGFGVGAIQQVGGAYCRGLSHPREWEAAIDAGRLGISAGLVLSDDDRIRAAVIESILCTDAVDFAFIAGRYNIDPRTYFARESRALVALAENGLLVFDQRGGEYGFCLTTSGQLLSRVVASQFDGYLGQADIRSNAPLRDRA